MTLTAIENYVLNFLQTSFTTGNWTQAEIDQYIRDSELMTHGMIAEKYENFFRTTSQLSVTANQALVDLPTNLYRTLEVDRIVGLGASTSNLLRLTKVERTVEHQWLARADGSFFLLGGPNTTAYPMYYRQHGQKQIELLPTPSATTANSLLIGYIYRPAAMAAGTHVPFQEVAGAGGSGKDNIEEFHDILGKYAIEMCLNKEEAYPQADRIRQERLWREGQLMDFLARMNVQEPKTIHETSSCWDF